MGSGKSRLGKRLANHLNCSFIDLDLEIEKETSRCIPDYFEEFGEQAFRALEHQQISKSTQLTDVVVSCGGGSPCFHNNKELMLRNGIVVFLTVKHEVLVDRLWTHKNSRPLISKMKDQEQLSNFIHNHLATRLPFYAQAHITYDNSYPESDLTNLAALINQL